MPLPTCTVTCTFVDALGAPLAGARVTAELSVPEVYESVVVPSVVSGLTDANGVCTLALFPNALGQASSRYTVRLSSTRANVLCYAVVPDQPTALLEAILVDRDVDTPPQLLQGPPGESAYQVAVAGGFSGTEAEWLASLQGPPGPGVVSDADLVFESPNDTTLRVGKLGGDGVMRYVDLTLIAAAAPEAPTLADIEAYRTSATSWEGIPYGNASWAEPGLGQFYQVLSVFLPAGDPPPGGRPLVVHCHANGTDYVVGDGGVVGTNVKAPALGVDYGFATIEFRHPVTNVSEGAVHTDIGRALQYLRALAPALGLNPSAIFVHARSRGTLAFWQALQADMADVNAPTYAGRQSSLPQGLWLINAQVAYSTARFGELYVVEADRAALLAANPDDPRWQNAIDAVPTAAILPPVVMVHEAQYFNRLITLAELTAWDALPNMSPLHYPDAGLVTKAAYTARNLAHQCAVWDAETDNVEQQADMVTWMRYVLEGMSSVEALAMARAKRRGAEAHYIRDDLSGVFVNSDGSGGAPVLGGPIGAIVAGQHGVANRTTVPPLGYGAGQTTALNKPKLYTMASGHYGYGFDSTDRMAVPMPSDGTPNWRAFTDTGEVTTLTSATTSSYLFGQAALDGKVVALEIGSDAVITDNDLKLYRAFAASWAGRSYP